MSVSDLATTSCQFRDTSRSLLLRGRKCTKVFVALNTAYLVIHVHLNLSKCLVNSEKHLPHACFNGLSACFLFIKAFGVLKAAILYSSISSFKRRMRSCNVLSPFFGVAHMLPVLKELHIIVCRPVPLTGWIAVPQYVFASILQGIRSDSQIMCYRDQSMTLTQGIQQCFRFENNDRPIPRYVQPVAVETILDVAGYFVLPALESNHKTQPIAK